MFERHAASVTKSLAPQFKASFAFNRYLADIVTDAGQKDLLTSDP